MNFIKAYTTGLKIIFSKRKLWLLLYALNLLFAVFLAYPLSTFLEEKLGYTLATDELFQEFDFSILNDFMHEYGDSVSILFNQSLVGLVLYLLFSVFTVGGILTVFKLKKEANYFSDFWVGGGRYFWRLLRLMIYFLVFQGLTFVLFFTIFSMLTAGGMERFENEGEIIQRGLWVLPFYLFIAMLLFLIHDYAKIHIVHTDKVVIFQPILQAFRWVFSNFSQALLLYILNLLTLGILFFIYWQLDFSNSILATFVLGQFFVLAQIGSKLLNLASATILYKHRMRYE